MTDLSKQVWKFQEGIVYLLIREIGIAPERILWGESPEGLSVDTDILIEENNGGGICHAIMITHGTGDNAGQMKFWRSLNEIFELRLVYPNICIINILFQSGVPPVTLQAMLRLCDSTVIVEETPSMHPLVELGFSVTKKSLVGEGREEVLKHLEKWRESCSANEAKAILSLRQYLEQNLENPPSTNLPWETILGEHAAIRIGNVTEHTGFRRAMSKLSVISDSDFEEINKMWREPVPFIQPHIKILGITRRSIRGYLLADPDILQLFSKLNSCSIQYLRSRAREQIEVLPRLEEQLKAAAQFKVFSNWIRENWDDVTNGNQLEDLFRQCFDDPGSFGLELNFELTWHWLFDAIVYILKDIRGGRHGFSFSKLAAELGVTGVIGRSQRLKFSYYAERRRNLDDELLTATANYLARLLAEEVDPEQLNIRAEQVSEMRTDGVLERLMNAQEFEPLYWLIEHECEGAGLLYCLDKAVPSLISDLHPKRPGTTKLGLIGAMTTENCKLAIHCRTAHDGATDKRKELCARGKSLRIRLSDEGADFHLDGKIALILDGDWKDRDVDLLVRSGWTRIYTPWEIAELINDAKT
jgi:hypothetical protein